MQGSEQYKDVLEGWHGFVQATGLAKSRVKDTDIHQDQHIKLLRNTVQEDVTGFSFALSQLQSQGLKQRFVSLDEEGMQTCEALQLGFPLLRVVEGSKAFFVPLFRFTLPDNWHGQLPLQVSVPVKQGIEVTPDIAAFGQYLGIDIQELGAERHMMSIAAACMGTHFDNFVDLFQAFLKWVQQRLIDMGVETRTATDVRLESVITGLISPQVLTDFNTKEQLKDYDVLLKSAQSEAYPLLRQYVQQRAIDDLAGARQDASRFPYGLFEDKHPLGRGQMMTLGQVSSGASLVAVQGAPGTGKTTLFKSLIASQLVARAQACMAGQDRNLGLVVTSTAKKAVENVIDDLRADQCLKDVDWLYFMAGDKVQVSREIERVHKLLAQLQTEEYDAQQQQALATRIAETQQQIDQGFAQFQIHEQRFQTARAKLADDTPDTFVQRLEVLRCDALVSGAKLGLVSAQEPLPDMSVLLNRCNDAQVALQSLAKEYSQAQDRLSRSYRRLIAAPFTEDRYAQWMDSTLSETVEDLFCGYPQGVFGALRGWMRRKHYQRAVEHLRQTWPDEFADYGLHAMTYHRLAELAHNRKQWLTAADADVTLETLKRGAPDSAVVRALALLEGAIAHVAERTQAWDDYAAAQRTMAGAFPEGDWIEVLRLRYVTQQRALFEHSIAYLWQEILRQKTLLGEALPLWCNLLAGQKHSGFYKWKDKFDEFYRLISLAYPVMASTLASVQKLAGYRLTDLNGFTPYHISLVDEAGMVSVESLVPLLARSQRAIVVGDPLQIEPIRTLGAPTADKLKAQYFADNALYEAVSPMLVTAYHRAAGTLSGAITETGNGIVLDEHRRSQPPIAELFMDIAGYRGVKVCTAATGSRIKAACDNMGGFNLMFYGVQGRKGQLPNTNLDEVEAIGLLLDKLEQAGYDLTQDVGIITPYANQKSLLIRAHGERMNQRQSLKIGSVHQFQGVGFEVIIYSPVICHRSDRDNFQNDKPNLLNVAVSRAKQQFIVVGNQQRLLAAGRSLGKLAQTCSASFFVDMEPQSPSFQSLSSNGVQHYFDCEHLGAFQTLLSNSQRSFIVVVPWIRQGTNRSHPPLKLLREAQQRGVAVTVCYGYASQDHVDADDGDDWLIQAYRQELGAHNVIRVPEGTHEKILLVDDRLATIGSWNWLSHSYYRYCETSNSKPLALRRETTVEVRDPALIEQLRMRTGLGDCSV